MRAILRTTFYINKFVAKAILSCEIQVSVS